MQPITPGPRVHFGNTPPSGEGAQGASPKEGMKPKKLLDQFKKGAGTIISGGDGELSLIGRLKRGLSRTIDKTIFRPRGWLELLSCFTAVGFIFPIKHFIEGFLNINSILIPRIIQLNSCLKSKNNKYSTLVSLLKGKVNRSYIAEQERLEKKIKVASIKGPLGNLKVKTYT